ncbi:hypothetical protein LTR94_036388, partial [Friedmanniomyces endolithicus]
AREDVPQTGDGVQVDGVAGIGHHPFAVPVLAQLPPVGPGAPFAVRDIVQHARPPVGLGIAVRLDPEQVDVVDPVAVAPALVDVADVGLPDVGIGPVEGA